MARPRKSFALWLTGHILHGLFAALIFGVCGLLLWRVLFSGLLPSEMKRLSPNAALAAAYAEQGDLSLFSQEQATVTRGESNQGYFGVPRFVFIEEAKQVQVVLRYNNGTLKHVREDFGLSELPPRGEQIFDTTLVMVTDLTPDDQSDNKDGSETLGKTRLTPTSAEFDTTLLYTYCLLTFDNVEIKPDTIVAYLDVYYSAAVDYDAAAYGTLRLYHAEEARIEEKLSSKEKRLLADFKD